MISFITDFYIPVFIKEKNFGFYTINAVALGFTGLYLALINKRFGPFIKWAGICFCTMHIGALVLDFFYELKTHGAPFMVIIWILYSLPVIVCLVALLLKKPRKVV